MSTITLRATKGSPLTNTEVDTNFSNLNTDKLEATYSGAMNSLTGGTSIATLGTVTTGTWSATAIGATKGGTGLTTYATGDILYASAANTLSKLAKPATASYLKMAADGTPSWDTLGLDDITATGTITTGTWNASVIGTAYGGTGVANGSNNTITFTGNYTLGLTLSANTSVTLPTTGTLATLAGSETLTNKTINGSNNTITNVSLTSGVTGTLPVGNGGTGLTSVTSGYIPYGNGTSALSTSVNFNYTGTALNVNGSSSPSINVTGTGGYPSLALFSDQATGYSPSIMQFYRRSATSSTTPNQSQLGEIRWSGMDSAGTPAYSNMAQIYATMEGSNAAGGAATSLIFATGASGVQARSVFALNSSGALGVGVTTQSYGTSGQVLTSQGSGAAPTWATSSAATTGKAIAMAMVFGG